jgi:hypothetical protein
MSDLLKGNFNTKKTIVDVQNKTESLEQRFEKEALKKLGGSIAFVAKQEVIWDDDKSKNNK